MPALPSRRSALIAASFRASMGLRPNLLPCALARSSPALTRSWIITRSNSAKTPIIWNRALTTAYVSRGPTGRLKADRAHLSAGPSHAVRAVACWGWCPARSR
jgi:hypothetical protein